MSQTVTPFRVQDAQDKLDKIVNAMAPKDRETALAEFNRPLTDMGLSVRTTNGLEEAGVHTVGLLLMCPQEWLLSIPNIGVKTLEEIFTGLEAIGYYRDGRKPSETDEQIRTRRRKMYRAQFGFD